MLDLLRILEASIAAPTGMFDRRKGESVMPIQVIFFDLGNTLVRISPRSWLAGAELLLADLKDFGFRLGIISNTAGLMLRTEILDLLPADFDLDLFDPSLILFSSELGISKPDPAIFLEAITLAARPAESCLYVSENIVETLVAQSAGMMTIRVQPPPGNDLSILTVRIAEFQNIAS